MVMDFSCKVRVVFLCGFQNDLDAVQVLNPLCMRDTRIGRTLEPFVSLCDAR